MKNGFTKVYYIPSSKDGKQKMKEATKFLLEKFHLVMPSKMRVEPERLTQHFRFYASGTNLTRFPREIAIVWRESKRTANKATYALYFRDHRYKETKITSLEALYHMLTILPVPVVEIMPRDK